MPNKNKKTIIKNLSSSEIDAYFLSISEKKFRTKQLLEAMYLKQYRSFEEIKTLPVELRQKLNSEFEFDSLHIVSIKESIDTSRKFLFKTHDDNIVETVFLPNAQNTGERNTICISTMVGCPLACKFCATAKLGFQRNLTSGEIIDQIILTIRELRVPINNIVIMGMGEPLLNFKNILQALDYIINYKICKRKSITLSTAGISKKIIEFANSNVATKIAFSLHSPQNKVRKMLMPAAEKIEEVCEALDYYYHKTKFAITFEYLLLDGINNTNEDIKKLIKLARRFPSKINIIPYNDISFTGNIDELTAASPKQIQEFATRLKEAGITAIIRKSQGSDIEAACGQLAFKLTTKQTL